MVKISNYTVEKCVKPVLEMSIERIGVESKQVPPSKLRKSKSETWLQLPFLLKYAKKIKSMLYIGYGRHELAFTIGVFLLP